MQIESRVQIDVLERPDELRLAKVCALGEKRIDGLQVAVVGITVATRHVGFQAKTRRPGDVCEREAGVAGGRPRGNVSISQLAELINELEVPIPTGMPSP